MRKIKSLYENRIKANQQKASKMEAALLNQTYQVYVYSNAGPVGPTKGGGNVKIRGVWGNVVKSTRPSL